MQLTEEDELRWDDGTANAEYCLDQFNLVGRVSQQGPRLSYLIKAKFCQVVFFWLQWEAVGMLAAGLGIFGLLAAAARFNDKASRVPYVSCFDKSVSGLRLQCTPRTAASPCQVLPRA